MIHPKYVVMLKPSATLTTGNLGMESAIVRAHLSDDEKSVSIVSSDASSSDAPARTRGRGRGRGRPRGVKAKRGRGRGRGSKNPTVTADPLIPDQNTGLHQKLKLEGTLESQIAKRMAAFLLACGGPGSFKSDARVAYTFTLSKFQSGRVDDNAPMVQRLCEFSGVVCSMHYSQRTWALGNINPSHGVGSFGSFELGLPLEFLQTEQLMNLIYQRFLHYNLRDDEVVIAASCRTLKITNFISTFYTAVLLYVFLFFWLSLVVKTHD